VFLNPDEVALLTGFHRVKTTEIYLRARAGEKVTPTK